MNEKLKDIGKRIQKTRKEKGISQAALAEQINISTPYLSDIENGKVSYSVTILMDITEALQVSADWLLRSDTPTTNSIQIQEVSNILSDCTPDEAESLLHLLTETKKAIRKNRDYEIKSVNSFTTRYSMIIMKAGGSYILLPALLILLTQILSHVNKTYW